jgi:hypothetical protein
LWLYSNFWNLHKFELPILFGYYHNWWQPSCFLSRLYKYVINSLCMYCLTTTTQFGFILYLTWHVGGINVSNLMWCCVNFGYVFQVLICLSKNKLCSSSPYTSK